MAIYCSCLLCHANVATSQLSNHYGAKTCLAGGKIKPLEQCPHCHLAQSDNFNMANHVRWCKANPNYKPNRNIGNSQMQTPEALLKKKETITKMYRSGLIDTAGRARNAVATRRANGTLNHSAETKEKLSKNANCHVRRHTHKFIDKIGREFNFDSSWEDALAIRLDKLNARWTRPDPVIWFDLQGNKRRYYADFYLPDYDLYLDPKNSFVISKQLEKLSILPTLINLKVIPSLKECEEFELPERTLEK